MQHKNANSKELTSWGRNSRFTSFYLNEKISLTFLHLSFPRYIFFSLPER